MLRLNLRSFLFFSFFFLGLNAFTSFAQNRVTYAGGSGNETFYDVTQLSDGTFLVAGTTSSLSWMTPSVSTTVLSATGLSNASGTNVFGFIMQLNGNMSQVLRLVHFPQGAVEDIKFMKFTSRLGQTTGDLFISGTTADSKTNNGGYFIAKLNNNFVGGTPTALTWSKKVWAEGEIQTAQPWDVGSDGKVLYVSGQYNATDWSQLWRTDAAGNDEVVENFTTHWKVGGGEHYGTASSYSGGGAAGLLYSGVVLKVGNRCSLRSWTQADFDAITPDENGGTKKGKMPLDVFYNTPCTPGTGPTTGGGYTGYKINTQTLGATCVTVDRRNNQFYLGFNMKSLLPNGNADFEPAVVAFNADGGIRWWSRLYHEINPAGQQQNSSPDQYVDALAMDYAADNLVVVARCHGNNTENFWEGNTIAANTAATAFQNRFTGTNGNAHYQWIGKMRTSDGQLQRSTYMGEYNEGTNNYGAAHPDPNMDGNPNPNGGWANLNTTRMPKNSVRITADGSVCLVAAGRRTMTTANAHQKMPLMSTGLTGTWNNFARVYKPDLTVPLYSSLVVGQWNTSTGVGGDNVDLYGIWKTQTGVVAVGRSRSGGNAIPTVNVPAWGSASESGTQSAVFAYLTATNLFNAADGAAVVVPVELLNFWGNTVECNEIPHCFGKGGQNVLAWATATERNTSHFDIERSDNGKNFNKIGAVQAKGSNSTYQLTDDLSFGKLPTFQKVWYYRLKINDLDGKSNYSQVISLQSKGATKVKAYPSVTSGILTIENAASVNIVNPIGQVVLTFPKLSTLEKLDVAALPSGLYVLRGVDTEGSLFLERFFKK